MGEIINRPVPHRRLEFTGERLTSTQGGQAAIEHWHRYLLARELVRGRDVLDIACGEGYGAALLCQTAKSVIGVDGSAEAVQHAQAAYTGENLRYVEGDATRIPLPAASIDSVISFETLEHFAEHDAFLSEVKRVLRPGGFLLISTPDRDLYSPASGPPNAYHKLELTTEQFLTALRRHFTVVRHQGQRALIGSAMVQTHGDGASPLCFERRGPDHFEASIGISRARYAVALASNGSEPAFPDSVFIDSDELDFFDGPTLQRYVAEAPLLAASLAHTAELEAFLDALTAQLAAAEQRIVAAEAHSLNLEAALRDQAAHLAATQQHTDDLHAIHRQICADFEILMA